MRIDNGTGTSKRCNVAWDYLCNYGSYCCTNKEELRQIIKLNNGYNSLVNEIHNINKRQTNLLDSHNKSNKLNKTNKSNNELDNIYCVTLSYELADLLNLPKSIIPHLKDVTSALNTYIKTHNLQKGGNIILDEHLKILLTRKHKSLTTVPFVKLQGLLYHHFKY